jgi:hypothetical protein
MMAEWQLAYAACQKLHPSTEEAWRLKLHPWTEEVRLRLRPRIVAARPLRREGEELVVWVPCREMQPRG